MEKTEFEQRLSLVDYIRKQISGVSQEIKSQKSMIPTFVQSTVDLASKRDALFDKYLNSIKGFSFEETSPIDLFPGIKPVLNNINVEELQSKSEEMSNCAREITSLNEEYKLARSSSISTIKKLLGNLVELLKQEDQIYELQMELLKDLDSPYDVGMIAKSTK